VKAVILVGGEGTRLRPLTLITPKSMVPVVNRPFLEHMVKYLQRHRINDIVLALCYLPDAIQRYFGDGNSFGIKLAYAIEDSPLGTAGAVKNVCEHVIDTFFVLNGDVFTDINLTEMLQFHRQKKSIATIALTTVKDPSMYGVIETDVEGRVQRFVEKPNRGEVTSNTINAGVYILEPRVLELVPKNQKFMFERGVFPVLVERGEPVYGYKATNAYWVDIGTPEKYKMLHYDLLSGKVERELPGEEIGEQIWIEGNVDVSPKARIKGPVVIGEKCAVGAGAYIKGPSSIGSDCTIGSGSVIEKAIIWNNSRLGQKTSLKGCVIANNVSIGDRAQVPEGCVLGHDVILGSDEKLKRNTNVWPK